MSALPIRSRRRPRIGWRKHAPSQTTRLRGPRTSLPRQNSSIRGQTRIHQLPSNPPPAPPRALTLRQAKGLRRSAHPAKTSPHRPTSFHRPRARPLDGRCPRMTARRPTSLIRLTTRLRPMTQYGRTRARRSTRLSRRMGRELQSARWVRRIGPGMRILSWVQATARRAASPSLQIARRRRIAWCLGIALFLRLRARWAGSRPPPVSRSRLVGRRVRMAWRVGMVHCVQAGSGRRAGLSRRNEAGLGMALGMWAPMRPAASLSPRIARRLPIAWRLADVGPVARVARRVAVRPTARLLRWSLRGLLGGLVGRGVGGGGRWGEGLGGDGRGGGVRSRSGLGML